MNRYQRQMLLPTIGDEGQRRIASSTALVVGCGALGSVIADSLVRAGVGRLKIIDRDFVERVNLHRQVLFDESDADEALPKAEAAARKLRRINSEINIESHAADFNPTNARQLAQGCDVLIDGTDNFEARFLLNDLSVSLGMPYVYGGAVGTMGTLLTILPRTLKENSPWEQSGVVSPCLRCVFDEAPPPGAVATCDTVGVLGPLPVMIGAAEAVEAIKVMVGDWANVCRSLRSLDVWANVSREVALAKNLNVDCPCCAKRQFDYLEGDSTTRAVSLCGRHAVQILPQGAAEGESDCAACIDFQTIAKRLEPDTQVTVTPFTLRAQLPFANGVVRLTLFPDGRAIMQGTTDFSQAKTLYSRYVGL